MPRSNPSHVSNSRANSTRFRERDLSRAGVIFHYNLNRAPDHLTLLSSRINSIPEELESCTTLEKLARYFSKADSTSSDEREALSRIHHPSNLAIERCRLKHERRWMRKVNEPMFAAFEDAAEQEMLTVNEDYEWVSGEDLMPIGAESLNNPKPDIAYGLAYEEQDGDETQTESPQLSIERLSALSALPHARLRYSPSEKEDILFPALIYEAKSDSNPIMWAENQAAVGVTRCLALLRDLDAVSGNVGPPAVVAMVTSAGSTWQIHLATWVDGRGSTSWKVHIYPITAGFFIHKETDRFRLHLTLLRLRTWLTTEHRAWVTHRLSLVSSLAATGP
ncbi:unnamed protein product [Jaminaea pallidilutea]